jgi:hypothetical protein
MQKLFFFFRISSDIMTHINQEPRQLQIRNWGTVQVQPFYCVCIRSSVHYYFSYMHVVSRQRPIDS